MRAPRCAPLTLVPLAPCHRFASLQEELTSTNHGIRTTPALEWCYVVDPTELTTVQAMLERELRVVLPSDWQPRQAAGRAADGSIRRRWPPKSLREMEREELAALNHRLRSLEASPLKREEMVGGRLYSGPMYTHYNQVMRSRIRSELDPEEENGEAARGTAMSTRTAAGPLAAEKSRYTTTLHCINSCVTRLSKLTKAERVYRGVSGTLPEAFFRADSQMLRGGIEAGFMSCTTDRDIAIRYMQGANARHGGPAILFEATMGIVSRGADLSEISQFTAVSIPLSTQRAQALQAAEAASTVPRLTPPSTAPKRPRRRNARAQLDPPYRASHPECLAS